jgi:hypothetical protein
MSKYFPKASFAQIDSLSLAEPLADALEHPTGAAVTRHFDLPPVLHAATVGLYFAVLAVFAFAFGEKAMIIPFAIFAIFIVGGFGVPALWQVMQPAHSDRPLDWASFKRFGIATHTGVLASKDAIVQVLMLPLFILSWAVIIAFIAAFV